MGYTDIIKEILDRAGADEGDLVEVVMEGRTFKGVIMPHHDFSDIGILTIKLGNGYNIGLDLGQGATVTVLQKGEMPSISRDLEERDPEKACISFISTGGTIASFVDYRTGAVHPALTSKDLIYSNPELTQHCNPRAKVLYSILSENMRPQYWQNLAVEVANELNGGANGVVVPHGTDTMGYTAAALAFMLDGLTGPVVLVGSQRSSDRPSSDAHLNLIGAVTVARADLGEVVVVMHDGPSDNRLAVHRGTKVRKMHSSRRDAFRSMNSSPIGYVIDEEVQFVADHRRRAEGPVRVDDRMEKDVALLYFYPGMNPGFLLDVLKRNKGAVIAGTGLGHISSDLIEIIEELDEMMPVVMTTQCLEGTVDLEVYSSGRDLLRMGAIQGGDMLPETAYIKLMCVLGRTGDLDEVREMMGTDLAGELGSRRLIRDNGHGPGGPGEAG